MAKKKIAIIGECMVELSGQPFSRMQQNYGGDSINTAIYLKTLNGDNIDVHFVSSMGTDLLSEAVIRKWQEHNINTDFVLANAKKHAGLYMIQNDDDGERTFQYWRNDSAAKYMVQHEKFPQVINKLSSFDAIYFSGISLAILPETDCLILLTYLENLKEQGVKIIYDSNYRPTLWSSVEHCQQSNNKAYSLADLALVTFDDETQLWHDDSIDTCRQRLHNLGVNALVIKDGANGCQYSQANSSGEVIAHSYKTSAVANVIDTTAAGDSFNAGFLSQWLVGHSIQQCAHYGNALAGQVIQQQGAIVTVDKSAIESLTL